MVYDAQVYVKNKDKISLQRKHRRRRNPACAVLEDSRRSDRKQGRENDLDQPFIESFLAQPCTYCGETRLRMTLDRVDNSLGHLKSNVLPACERCNYVRRDMPFEAWCLIAQAMRRSREQGLFGDWVGSIHTREPLKPLPEASSQIKHGTLSGYAKCGPPRCEECRKAMRDWKRGRRAMGK